MTVDSVLDIAIGFGLTWFILRAILRARQGKPKSLPLYFDSSDIASAQRRKYRR